MLRGRPETLVRLYGSIESFVKALGPVEFVARERYVLLRSRRIFTDLVIMTDAIRIAIHLQRRVDDDRFFRIVSDRKKVTHVAKLHTEDDFDGIKPYVKEAYTASLSEPVK